MDIRIITATNRDLRRAVSEGTFREDLYFRLGISLMMPPLRDRHADISLLARYFLEKYSRRCRRRVDAIAPDALAAVLAYDWPGNVRELETVIERALVLGSSETLVPEDLPEEVRDTDTRSVSRGEFDKAIRAAKKEIVRRALDRTDYDYAEAAKWLGIHVNALHRLITVLGIPRKPR